MANKKVIKASEIDDKLKSVSSNISNLDNAVITPNDLRMAIMDYVDINIPLYKEELTDEHLWKCIEWGVGYFNEYPPILDTTYTLQNFPNKKILLDLATIEALKLTALVELRGEMQYSDGGVQSTIYYKSQPFLQLRQDLKQTIDNEMAGMKRSMNINQCYGDLC